MALVLYRIHVDPLAPRLRIDSHEMGICDGSEKSDLSPMEAFVGSVGGPPTSNKQFFAIQKGVLALPENAWAESERMYYCCTAVGELLAVETSFATFRVINALVTVPQLADGAAPCDLSYCRPIFRIAGNDPTDLFCFDGLGVPGDQFKWIYDNEGFTGLTFERLWQGA